MVGCNANHQHTAENECNVNQSSIKLVIGMKRFCRGIHTTMEIDTPFDSWSWVDLDKDTSDIDAAVMLER